MVSLYKYWPTDDNVKCRAISSIFRVDAYISSLLFQWAKRTNQDREDGWVVRGSFDHSSHSREKATINFLAKFYVYLCRISEYNSDEHCTPGKEQKLSFLRERIPYQRKIYHLPEIQLDSGRCTVLRRLYTGRWGHTRVGQPSRTHRCLH